MKGFALLVILVTVFVIIWSGVDAGRQALTQHRAAQAQILGY